MNKNHNTKINIRKILKLEKIHDFNLYIWILKLQTVYSEMNIRNM